MGQADRPGLQEAPRARTVGLWFLWSKHVPSLKVKPHSVPPAHAFPAPFSHPTTLPSELPTDMTDLGSRAQKNHLGFCLPCTSPGPQKRPCTPAPPLL